MSAPSRACFCGMRGPWVPVPRLSVTPEGCLKKRQVAFTSSRQVLFIQCPAAKEICRPLQGVKGGAPDGRFVGGITRLRSRTDDILAEGQSVAPREALICLLNLSSGGSKLVVVVVIGELAILLHSALTVHGRKAEWVKTN